MNLRYISAPGCVTIPKGPTIQPAYPWKRCHGCENFINKWKALTRRCPCLSTLAPDETRWVNVLFMDEVLTQGDDFPVTTDYKVETASDDPDLF